MSLYFLFDVMHWARISLIVSGLRFKSVKSSYNSIELSELWILIIISTKGMVYEINAWEGGENDVPQSSLHPL